VSFHIIFPSFTIGLASYLAVLEGMWLWTRDDAYRNLYLFWVKIFAIAFGMGVVSGVVMSYQFGTNWSVFSDKTGSVLGPLLAFEVLTAFFLEASFLGIMLFGWKRVGPRLHFVATLFVAGGTLLSAFWILAANSWMQTPTGYERKDGLFFATSFWDVIFNPSMPSRFMHMTIGAYLTTAFVVLGSAGLLSLFGRKSREINTMRRMAVLLIVIAAPLQLVVGHESGRIAHEYQPAKVAAMEGWWETQARQPSILFAIPDAENERNLLEFGVPGLGSWVVAGDSEATLKGLKDFAPDERPPVAIVFWSFRVMVGLGMLMILMGIVGVGLWWLGRLDRLRVFHAAAVLMAPSGFIAVLAGWVSAEVGRQPYVVYGVLRTADAISPVTAEQVSLSLLVFMVVYAIVFSTGVLYILRLIWKGPDEDETPVAGGVGAPGNALSALFTGPRTKESRHGN
jgi:cytochrome d ubiquinol oxidase subunit I